MEYVLTRAKIKAGKLSEVKAFMEECRDRKTEMEDAIKDVGIFLDCSFIDEQEETFYAFKIIRKHNDLRETMPNSKKEIWQWLNENAQNLFEDLEDMPSIFVMGEGQHAS